MAVSLSHRAVEIFAAVMRTGSATRAAELLRTSQPTVSRELGRLESQLALTLFERRRGRLLPTPQARTLFEEVERSYAGLERIAATASALRRTGVGQLAVACLPTFAQTLIPRAIRLLREAHPDASVSITALDSPLLESWLSEQRVDVGLLERAEAPAATELTPLLEVDEVCVLPAGHPLLARRRLDPGDFAGQPFVSLSPSDPYRSLVDAVFEAHGVERGLGLDTSSAASVCALVQEGLGVALVNPLTAAHLAGPALHVRPLSFSVPFEVALVRPSHRTQHPMADAFVAALEKAGQHMEQALRAVSCLPTRRNKR